MVVLRKIDFWTAVAFFLIGATIFNLAAGFDERSRSYPLFLAALLCVVSIGLFVQSLLSLTGKVADRNEAEILVSGPGVQSLLWIVWVVLLSVGAGYLGPSVLIVGGTIIVLRGGHFGKSILQSLAIVAVVFFMFYIIFDIPLPVLDAIESILG